VSTEAIVLVVDDDAMIRTLLMNALAGARGVRAVVARNGEEGLLRAWELGPALALVDLLMPGMDGATFCRLLRAHPRTASTRLVAVTGAEPFSARASALRAQTAAWVSKPFEVGELMDTVHRLLPTGGAARAAESSAWSPLTPREREVAALVARGFSNRRIAQALTLERGTVANHVRHVLLRLGLTTRTEVGVWVARDVRRRTEAGLG
jgi:DNA-binding NarL/FixJ family response regulator